MTDEKTWTVVKFTEEDSVEAVPTTWLLGYKCYWPTFTLERIIQAIKNHEVPNTCWPLHNIELFRHGTFDNYLQARNKAKMAECSSDLGYSDCDKSMRKLRQKKIISSSSEDDAQFVSKLPIPPACPIINKMPETSDISVGTLSDIHNDGISHEVETRMVIADTAASKKLPSQNDVANSKVALENQQCGCCQQHKNGELLKTLIRNQVITRNLIMAVKHLLETLKVKENTDILEINSSFFQMFTFPVNSIETLSEIEVYLKNETNLKKVVLELSKIGGNTIYEFIRRTLSMIMTNELAAQFSWYGAKKKNIFGDLKLATVLIGAADKINLGNRKDTEESVKKWLRRAKERSQM